MDDINSTVAINPQLCQQSSTAISLIAEIANDPLWSLDFYTILIYAKAS